MIKLNDLKNMRIEEFLNSPYFRELSSSAELLGTFLLIAGKAYDAEVTQGEAIIHNTDFSKDSLLDVAIGYFSLKDESKHHAEIEL